MLPTYRFIAIEGNIGAGKTTLCEMLAKQQGCSLLLEQFTDNPFLPFFYEHPERYAFPVELFFMTERHKQLQEHFAEPDLFQSRTVADYFFVKTLLFAKNNLSGEEFRLFRRLFKVLNATFPKPDILLYLHRPVDVLQQQIKKRGRDMERLITNEYLEELQHAYLQHFKKETQTPVIILEMEDADFVQEEAVFQEITGLFSQKYKPGVQSLSLKEIKSKCKI